MTLQAALVVKNPPANAGDMRRGFNALVGRIPWRREQQPFQLSSLENPMDREASQATVHSVAKSWT